jgi:hypothetical protein
MRANTTAVSCLVVALAAATAGAQETKVVTVGAEYAGGGGKRKVLGDGYRDLWTAPVRLEVLDLRKEGRGLTPVRQVGQAQSVGLALTGADGRSYTFRSLDKEPERMLPEAWRAGVPGIIVRDMTAGTHPAAALIQAGLAEAAGVPHTWPRLVVMPDDPSLGPFAKRFANLVGTIEEYPLAAGDGNPGFMGATEIVSSTRMWKKWMEGPENRPDGRAYLRARVVDLLADNYDRHRGQWRWMKLPEKDTWQPLPEDPDFVFMRRDGWVMRGARARAPQFLLFSDTYPRRLDGALGHGAEMDRWLFGDLTAEDFEAVARDVQSRMTDEAIERALRRMPPEWYAIDGPRTFERLRARRAGLVDYVLRVYRYHARNVDVQATDRNERVTVARAADGSVEVAIAVEGHEAGPYYRRRFLPSETSEVRIFLRGGDDRVQRSGQPGGAITIRVIAGGGADVVDDTNSGGTDVWRDAGTIEVTPGRGTDVRNEPWNNPAPVKDAPWIEPRSWGHWSVPAPLFGYAPDVALYLGYGFTRTSYGFRTLPNKSEQTLQGALATGDMAGRVRYSGTFRRPGSGLGYRVRALGSGVESYNYFGPGNDSAQITDRAVYKTRENVFLVAPSLRYEVGNRFEAQVGPEVRYSSTPTDSGTLVATQAPVGVGRFGLVALRGALAFDSRQDSLFRVKADVTDTSMAAGEDRQVGGIRFEAGGFFVPEAWDVQSQYGGAEGSVAGYLAGSRAHLALRAGGRKLWGDYAWFDAAYIGGSNNRGYNSHRFAGDSSLYGSASLLVWVGQLGTPVIPLRIGLIGFTDTGRVWVEGESSKTWHTSVGGGVLAQPALMPFVVNVLFGYSEEGTRFYFGLGYPF